jgi:hypothetical protein
MKTFKSYISEAQYGTDNKPPSNADKVKERQQREKDELKTRQERDLARAREQDFNKKEMDRRTELAKKKSEQDAKKQESVEGDDAEYVPEYLEDGTLVLVRTYKSTTPGQ